MAALVVLLATATMLATANRDLSQKELELYSTHIVVGTVEHVESVDVANPHHEEWVTTHTKHKVKVDYVHKTTDAPKEGEEDESIKVGQTIAILTWKPKIRPADAAVVHGVKGEHLVGERKAFYVHHMKPHNRGSYHESFPHHKDEPGVAYYNALTPNGVGSPDDLNKKDEM